jgi:hypothetical protein
MHVTTAKKFKQSNTGEFRRIAEIDDPMTALDRCRSAITHTTRVYWAKRQIYLGVLAATYERISQSKKSWHKFIGKKFWDKAYGRRPAMDDRSNGLEFVIRYGERAITRKEYQNAWRHAVTAQYLLNQGVKPIDFPGYLGKVGQGMKATYEKALAEDKIAKGAKGGTANITTPKSNKVTTKDRNFDNREDRERSASGTHKGINADDQETGRMKMRKLKLIGKDELIQKLILIPFDSTIDIRIKPVQDEQGHRSLRVLKLLASPATGKATSERRKSNPLRRKPTSRHVKHSNRRHRRRTG